MIKLASMAYTRENYLDRVKKVNETYRVFSVKGIPNETIYREYIKGQFNISRSTFYQYLTVPYAAELKKIRKSREKDDWKLNDAL